MPELPEVENARRCLEGWLRGRRLAGVRTLDDKVWRGSVATRPPTGPSLPPPELAGDALQAVHRHGKRLGLVFSTAELYVHLGMTGRWVAAEEAPRGARLALLREDGPPVWFADLRRFGSVVPVPDVAAILAHGHGPDALSPLAGEALAARFSGRRAIKVALMDQKCLAGLGNIHAAEVLYQTGIHPTRRIHQLGTADWQALAARIPAHLADVVAAAGDQPLTYVTEGGDNPFAVYGREGEPCPGCGTAIVRVRQSGRSTFFCPACQADPATSG